MAVVAGRGSGGSSGSSGGSGNPGGSLGRLGWLWLQLGRLRRLRQFWRQLGANRAAAAWGDSGAALAVMGNHELTALAFHTPDPEKPGSHLRPHNEKNSNQHAETRRQVPAGELDSYLSWFRTLPLWLDLDGLRVVHACWDDPGP